MSRLLIAGLAVVTVTGLLDAPVFAQEVGHGHTRGLSGSRGRMVALIDDERREWQGRLLEVAADAVTIELESQARQFPLPKVNRVDVDGDGVWDGAIKGALFGAFVGAVIFSDGRTALGGGLTYGLIGMGIDALNSCRHTVYRAPAVSASVKVASW